MNKDEMTTNQRIAKDLFGFEIFVSPPDKNGNHGGKEFLAPAGFSFADYAAVLPTVGAIGDVGVHLFDSDPSKAQLLIRVLNSKGLMVYVIFEPEEAVCCQIEDYDTYVATGKDLPTAVCAATVKWLDDQGEGCNHLWCFF